MSETEREQTGKDVDKWPRESKQETADRRQKYNQTSFIGWTSMKLEFSLVIDLILTPCSLCLSFSFSTVSVSMRLRLSLVHIWEENNGAAKKKRAETKKRTEKRKGRKKEERKKDIRTQADWHTAFIHFFLYTLKHLSIHIQHRAFYLSSIEQQYVMKNRRVKLQKSKRFQWFIFFSIIQFLFHILLENSKTEDLIHVELDTRCR